MASPSDPAPVRSEAEGDNAATAQDVGANAAEPLASEQPERSAASSPSPPGDMPQPPETAGTATAPSEPVTAHASDDDPADDEKEEGEAEDDEQDRAPGQQPADGAPPLPSEPVPEQQQPAEDDGWDFMWHAEAQRYYFVNRFTGAWTWENPRVAAASSSADVSAPAPAAAAQQPPAPPPLPTVAGGYNPAIHGDYDTWYAQNHPQDEEQVDAGAAAAAAGLADPSLLLSGGAFNRTTGRFQRPDQGLERHSDEAKSRRQLSGFFDVDAAANSHDGRSLKAERAGKRLSKGELKHFKEKRKARKEEKRRAWLRD